MIVYFPQPDRILSITIVYSTFDPIFPISKDWFQCPFCFQSIFFQTIFQTYVSKLEIPIITFQIYYSEIISNSCFPSQKMFPIYMEPSIESFVYILVSGRLRVICMRCGKSQSDICVVKTFFGALNYKNGKKKNFQNR